MRAETGAVQFGDDWPGVFLRGDDALYYAHCLSNFLRELDTRDVLARRAVEQFVNTLCSAQTSGSAAPAGCQVLHAFEDCVATTASESGIFEVIDDGNSTG